MTFRKTWISSSLAQILQCVWFILVIVSIYFQLMDLILIVYAGSFSFIFLLGFSQHHPSNIKLTLNGIYVDSLFFKLNEVRKIEVWNISTKTQHPISPGIDLVLEKDGQIYHFRETPISASPSDDRFHEALSRFVSEIKNQYPDLKTDDVNPYQEKMRPQRFVLYGTLSVFYSLLFFFFLLDALKWSGKEIEFRNPLFETIVFFVSSIVYLLHFKLIVFFSCPRNQWSKQLFDKVVLRKRLAAFGCALIFALAALRGMHYVDRNLGVSQEKEVSLKLIGVRFKYGKGCHGKLVFTGAGWRELPIGVDCRYLHNYEPGQSYLLKMKFGSLGGVMLMSPRRHFPRDAKKIEDYKDINEFLSETDNIRRIRSNSFNYFFSSDKEKIIERSTDSWNAKCEGGQSGYCRILGYYKELKGEYDLANSLYLRGCKKNDFQSCFATIIASKDEIMINEAKAILSENCIRDRNESCSVLLYARGVRKELRLSDPSVDALKSYCEKQDKAACLLFRYL